MIRPKLNEIIRWARPRWRRLLLWGGAGILGIFLVVQLFFPSNTLLPFTSVDNREVGGQSKSEVVKHLNDAYKSRNIALYFGSSQSPYRSPSPQEIGLTIDNESRIASVDYPLWLRIIPTSILWGSMLRPVPEPTYRHNDETLQNYMTKELGKSCDVLPKNASLTVKGDAIEIVRAQKGGTCQLDDVKHRLGMVKPRITEVTKVTVPMKERAPLILDAQATTMKKQITERIKDGVAMTTSGGNVVIPRNQLVSWLVFSTTDKEIIVTIDGSRAGTFVAGQLAPKVAKPAGVSKVSTQDFIEIARVDGAPGQTIDADKTLAALGSYITKGGDAPVVAVKSVAPRIEYTRSYSPTDVGLSALLKQYAEAHPGTYGISLIELSGQRRRATFQDTKQFHTASTYKLYVAYGTLKRIESGTWHWNDSVSGRTLEKCFDDMIVKSDNACGEALLAKIGYRAMTDELKSIGLTNTSFLGKEPQTTAGDLSTFNASLESGQMVSSDSRNRLLGAMKRNIFRQGIPAGANGTVADKVGFLNGDFHDAAIIYGPNGPMVLSVMTSGSSWATIADLTKQIEALRAR